MSIDPRFRVADNFGWQPCIPPLALGRVMDRISEGRGPSLRERVVKALAQLRRRLAK